MDPAKTAELRRGLKEQKKAKRAKQRTELQQRRQDAELIKQQSDAIAARQAEEYIESRRQALELQNSWKAQHALRKERPEWDLNDPKTKNGVPVDLDDPSLGAASMMKFAGDSPGRSKQLAAERNVYLQQQAEENARSRRAEAERERQYAEQLAAMTEHASQIAAEEYRSRRNEAYRMQQENKALARLKEEEKRSQKAQEDELTRLEQEVTRGRLNEEQRQMFANNGRVRRDEYKGLGSAGAAAVNAENAKILAAKEARRQAELREKLEADRLQAEQTRAAQDAASQAYLDAKAAELRLAQENRYLRQEAKRAEQQRNKAAKSNAVEASFFERFGN